MRRWIRDSREAEEAVRKDGMLLGDVPEGMRTSELCQIAVKKTPEAVRFVPEHLLPELRMAGDVPCGEQEEEPYRPGF